MKWLALSLLVFISGCIIISKISEQPAEPDMISVVWESDADSVYVQVNKNSEWVTQFTGTGSGNKNMEQRGNMYRLKAVKDDQVTYSKILFVK